MKILFIFIIYVFYNTFITGKVLSLPHNSKNHIICFQKYQ